jgi:DNA (cytosine-5)-methyltransferase 1
VVSAADYGVPQKRRRLIIVGMKKGTFWFPKPTHGPDAHIPHVASSTVIDKAKPFGEPPDCPVIYAKYPDPRRSPYAGHVYNGGGRPIDLSGPCHTLLASAGGYKTHWIDTMDIAPDYSAHLMAGGAPREGAVPGARRMTLEESALIQTFPADMWFAGSRSSQYTQVGDAVPPMLGHALGSALRSQLEGATISPMTHYQPEATLPLLVAA